MKLNNSIISSEMASAIAFNSLNQIESGVALTHPNHNVFFEKEGVLFQPKKGPEWKWQLTHIGTKTASLNTFPIQKVIPENKSPCIVSYEYGDITEEYHAKQKTVEQRFILANPLPLNGQDLVIKGQVESHGQFEELKNSWTWSSAEGQVQLGDVTVFDAAGHILMASMNVTSQSTEITVSARALANATYPVTVDPEIGGNDFRISDMGADGDSLFVALNPAVAYNSTNNEYLVVWSGDDDTGNLVNNESEIFGQRIDAETGAEVGTNDFRISDMGPDRNPSFGAFRPDVTYNSTDNEYLVVWSGDDDTGSLVNNESEIFGQRIDAATGAEVGINDFRISDMGPDGSVLFSAGNPAVAYNSKSQEYLVVWEGEDTLLNQEFEIYGQRIDAMTGAEVGTNDFRISDMGPDGDISFKAVNPDVAYNFEDNEYLVVWWGDDHDSPLKNEEFEIFGQRLDAMGMGTGTNDFRISNMGPDGSIFFSALHPAAAYNSANNEYLVVWRGNNGAIPLVDADFEIYGQRLEAKTGIEIGTNDFQISDMGPDGNSLFTSLNPTVAYHASNNEYLVVWGGDDNTLPLTDNAFEIFGQRLDAATGAEVGENDFCISDVGPTGPLFFAVDPAIAYNSVEYEFIIAWEVNNGEREIYGQELSLPSFIAPGKNFISLSLGGSQELIIKAGSDCAGFPYLILGTTTGTVPGFIIDGQAVPLNPDIYFNFTVSNPNSLFFPKSFGILDEQGQATATFVLPAGLSLSLAGTVAHHTVLIIDPQIIGGILKVTNAISILIGL